MEQKEQTMAAVFQQGFVLVVGVGADLPNLSLATMRQRLGLEHRSLEKTSAEMTAKLGVKAAFELSWQELEAGARILAGLLSLFAPAPMSWSWVES
jgi:hypothetical protein